MEQPILLPNQLTCRINGKHSFENMADGKALWWKF